MNNGSKPLIHLQDVTKVFLTDEVETHALSGIHLDIRDGEYISIAGPVGLRKIDVALDPRPARYPERRKLRAERIGSRQSFIPGARSYSQPRDRFHFPKFQS